MNCNLFGLKILGRKILHLCFSIQETILNCIHSHRPYWKCLQTNRTYNLEELDNVTPNTELHKITQMFKGGEPLPERFQTKNFYAIQSDEEQKEIAVHLAKLKAGKMVNLISCMCPMTL